MSDTVLFLCPHNAAKSVIAVTYFRHLVAQAGLDLTADSAGTDPDAAVWPSVIELLHDDGLQADQRIPRHVTPEDLAGARRIISMGCDLPATAAHSSNVEHWDDLPLASQDLPAARDAIRAKVETLVAQLRSSTGGMDAGG